MIQYLKLVWRISPRESLSKWVFILLFPVVHIQANSVITETNGKSYFTALCVRGLL